MPVYVLEKPDLDKYDLFKDSNPPNRQSLLEELRKRLSARNLHVEEALLIKREFHFNGGVQREVDEAYRNFAGRYPEDVETGYLGVVLPIDKPIPVERKVSRGHVDILLGSGSLIHHIAQYMQGREVVRITYQDRVRRGDSLIVYGKDVKPELIGSAVYLDLRLIEL